MDFFDSDNSYLKTAKIIEAQLYNTITQQNRPKPKPPSQKTKWKGCNNSFILKYKVCYFWLQSQINANKLYFIFLLAHNIDMILDKINESGIKHRTFNVDNLRTTDDILQVLDIIHREVVDRMVNITIVCHLDCIERILKQVINYLVSIVQVRTEVCLCILLIIDTLIQYTYPCMGHGETLKT